MSVKKEEGSSHKIYFPVCFLGDKPVNSNIHSNNNFSAMESGISKQTKRMAAKAREITRLTMIMKTCKIKFLCHRMMLFKIFCVKRNLRSKDE